MGMDIDYIAAKQAIGELEKILSNQKHGEREKIANDIIELVAKIRNKYERNNNRK